MKFRVPRIAGPAAIALAASIALWQYKEKFDPVWEPRYLASPGGLLLPRILTNVASLISGGLAGVVSR